MSLVRHGDKVFLYFLSPSNGTIGSGMKFFGNWNMVGHSPTDFAGSPLYLKNTNANHHLGSSITGNQPIAIKHGGEYQVRGEQQSDGKPVYKNGGHLKAEPDGDIFCNVNHVRSWECWSIWDGNNLNRINTTLEYNKVYSLRSAHGHWLYAGNDGKMRASSTHHGNAARFQILLCSSFNSANSGIVHKYR